MLGAHLEEGLKRFGVHYTEVECGRREMKAALTPSRFVVADLRESHGGDAQQSPLQYAHLAHYLPAIFLRAF